MKPIEIIAGERRQFSLTELLELLEGRKEEVLQLKNRITFDRAGSKQLDAQRASIQSSPPVFHTLFDDNPRVVSGSSCYNGLNVQGLFAWRFKERVSHEGVLPGANFDGWGFTRSGNWVHLGLLTRIKNVPEKDLQKYEEAIQVVICNTTLPKLFELLREPNKFEYCHTLEIFWAIWLGIGSWLAGVRKRTEERLAVLCKAAHEMEAETKFLDQAMRGNRS